MSDTTAMRMFAAVCDSLYGLGKVSTEQMRMVERTLLSYGFTVSLNKDYSLRLWLRGVPSDIGLGVVRCEYCGDGWPDETDGACPSCGAPLPLFRLSSYVPMGGIPAPSGTDRKP